MSIRATAPQILAGWPDVYGWPTDQEAHAIQSTRSELVLHEPDLGEDRCWYLAGQIVARCRRDWLDQDRVSA